MASETERNGIIEINDNRLLSDNKGLVLAGGWKTQQTVIRNGLA